MNKINNNKIKIIFSPTIDKPYIVLWKPRNLPSAPLYKDDMNNALYQAGELFPAIFKVKGKKEIEYGLLHRLDTATDGLLLIATNQEFYDYMQKEQKEGRFIKYYSAKCNINKDNPKLLKGYPEYILTESDMKLNKQYMIKSYFRPYGEGRKEVRPVTNNSGKAALKKTGKQKLYTTEINIKEVDKNNNTCIVICKLKEGYRHQVRCHLSWIGLPIINDTLYNAECSKTEENKKNAENEMKFSATKLEFKCPGGDLNSYEIALTWT